MDSLTVREMNGIEEMLQYLSVLNELYPSLTAVAYETELMDMLKNSSLPLFV